MNDVTPYANSVFEQPWWLDIVAPGQWGEVFVKDGEKVIGRLPYVLRRRNIIMPKFTQTLGPWIDESFRDYTPGNTQLSKQKEVIGDLISQLPKHKSMNITLDSVNDYILPYRWLGFRYTPLFSYRITSLKDLDFVYNNFNKTAKKNIRRAKNTVSINTTSDPEIMNYIVNKTFEHQNRGAPNSKDVIYDIINKCTVNGHGKMFTARDSNNNIHAASFLVYDNKIAYALIGGTDPVFRSSGAKSLVWWNEIKFAAEKSQMFDFEGSNIEGIENFIRQFGGERVTNYNVIKQSFLADCAEMAKPRVKRIIGYRN